VQCALIESYEVRERIALSKQLRLDVAQLTDVGRKRPHNEDNMAYVIPKDPQVMAQKGALFIVADGMGGHAAGEVASEIAVDTVSNAYYQGDSDDAAVSLLYAIRRANSLIHQRAAENMLRSGMGTTCVAAVVRGNVAYIANVGDSRAYLIHGNQVKQISQDHSWVAEQVRAGLLTEDQARSHAQRNVITRCLGTQAEVDVDVFSEQLEDGDTIILCTDGLSGLVDDNDLHTIVNQYVPQESVYHLVERANENGGPDNITAIVIHVQEAGWEPPNARYPVRVGGREVGDETALLGRLSGSQAGVSLRPDDLRTQGGTRSVSTGVLVSPDSVTAPQSVLGTKRRGRLFYPTMVLVVLLIVTLIGGGSYYFVRSHNDTATVDASLQAANGSINQAKAALARTPADPVTALNKLANARTSLLIVQAQNASLSNAESTQFTTLQQSFTSLGVNAIKTYNSQMGILTLPCNTTAKNTLSSGSTTAQARNLAAIQDTAGKNVLSYALGDDKNLYELTQQHSLGAKVNVGATTHVEAIASTGSRVLALLSVPGSGNTFTYRLSLFNPQQNGALQEASSVAVDSLPGYTPRFLTAWDTAVYLVQVPQAASSSTLIDTYTLTGTGAKQHLTAKPAQATISISKNIVSLAASMVAQKAQLIFLFSDGSIQSLRLINGGNASPSPVNIMIKATIPTPLSVSANNFVLSPQTPVPTPMPVVSTGPSALSVPGATMLAVGLAGNEAGHLYVVAPTMSTIGARILDLKVVSGVATPASTPAASSTPGAVGGGVASQNASTMYMDVAQQYAPDNTISNVRSIMVDPKGNGFYLLTQGSQNGTILVSQNACTP